MTLWGGPLHRLRLSGDKHTSVLFYATIILELWHVQQNLFLNTGSLAPEEVFEVKLEKSHP